MKTLSIMGALLLTTQLLMGQLGDIKLSEALKTGSGDRYGTYCGFAGTQPQARKEVEKMIHAREIGALESWIDSPNLVLKTYAAEGFIRLYPVIAITPELAQKIEDVKSMKDKIPTCHGCVLDKLTIEECLMKIEPGYDIDPPKDRNFAPRY